VTRIRWSHEDVHAAYHDSTSRRRRRRCHARRVLPMLPDHRRLHRSVLKHLWSVAERNDRNASERLDFFDQQIHDLTVASLERHVHHRAARVALLHVVERRQQTVHDGQQRACSVRIQSGHRNDLRLRIDESYQRAHQISVRSWLRLRARLLLQSTEMCRHIRDRRIQQKYRRVRVWRERRRIVQPVRRAVDHVQEPQRVVVEDQRIQRIRRCFLQLHGREASVLFDHQPDGRFMDFGAFGRREREVSFAVKHDSVLLSERRNAYHTDLISEEADVRLTPNDFQETNQKEDRSHRIHIIRIILKEIISC